MCHMTLKHIYIRQFDEEYIISTECFSFFISSFKIVASTGIRIHHLPPIFCACQKGRLSRLDNIIIKKIQIIIILI